MSEGEYKSLRDLFIRIARGKYPIGYKRLKQLELIPGKSGSAPTYEVKFNEVALLLLQYLNIELEGKEPIQKQAAFNRIINDIISSAD